MTDAVHTELKIPADDGFELAATLTTAESTPEPNPAREPIIVVIASAAAVPRTYYARFARFLAQQGVPALTFDYRGIGGSRPVSLKGFQARMRDWGELDVPGVLKFVHREYPGHRIHWVGHSYGGFATGLAHNNHLVARQLAIATMSGHWAMMQGVERYRVAALMGYLVPPLVRGLGYFPGRLMGAEDLPRGVFLEWARWVMTPDFIFGDTTLSATRHFASFKAPIQFARIEDDSWASSEGVQHMMSQWPNAAERSLWQITVADSGAKRIGHLGFFRSEFRDTLWPKAADWLLRTSDA